MDTTRTKEKSNPNSFGYAPSKLRNLDFSKANGQTLTVPYAYQVVQLDSTIRNSLIEMFMAGMAKTKFSFRWTWRFYTNMKNYEKPMNTLKLPSHLPQLKLEPTITTNEVGHFHQHSPLQELMVEQPTMSTTHFLALVNKQKKKSRSSCVEFCVLQAAASRH